jgi:hypothetical protein
MSGANQICTAKNVGTQSLLLMLSFDSALLLCLQTLVSELMTKMILRLAVSIITGSIKQTSNYEQQ